MARKSDLADRVVTLARAAKQTGALSTPRHFTEIENLSLVGSTQVCKLTLAARSQDWMLGQVMEALTFLREMPPDKWERPFVIAIPLKDSRGEPHFNWRDSPTRNYKNFEHFYRTELESTFGKWSKLQARWQRVVDGKATAEEIKTEILSEREIGIPGGKAGPGRGNKTADNISRFSHGTSRAYILARLDRDGHTALAARVRAETLSANAAAIVVGYRKEPTPLDLLRKIWKKASKVERQTFRNEIGAFDNGR
jgi:hypothetical protein